MTDVRGASVDRLAEHGEPAPDLLGIVRRRWVWLMFGALLGLVGAQLFAWTTSAKYEARATLLLIAAGNEVAPSGGRARTLDVETWATVARSTDLLQQVADQMSLDLSDVQQRSTATAAATGDTIVLTFTGTSASDAVNGAEIYSEAFLATRHASVNAVTADRARRLEDLIQALQTQIDDYAAQIDQAQADGTRESNARLAVLRTQQQIAVDRLGSATAELDQLDSNAETGRFVVQPSTSVTRAGLAGSVILLSGLFVGGLLGFVLALIRDRYDDRYRTMLLVEGSDGQELARVPYVRAREARQGLPPQPYGRLLARLVFARDGRTGPVRTVALLPVDGTTMPPDTADMLAEALHASARANGIPSRILVEAPAGGKGAHGAGERARRVPETASGDELVLLPQQPLDRLPLGLGVAGSADATLLIVSDHSRASDVRQALEDLRGVGAGVVNVVAVTGVGHGRRVVNAAFGRRGAPSTAAAADAY